MKCECGYNPMDEFKLRLKKYPLVCLYLCPECNFITVENRYSKIRVNYEKAWKDLIEFLETTCRQTQEINDWYHSGMGAGFNSIFKKMKEIIDE